MKTVIFLGAGASSGDGAPLQGEIFSKYFGRQRGAGDLLECDEDELLKEYFHEMFGLGSDELDSDTTKFPTFEEAIGILDLAIMRDETFKGFNIHQIRLIRHSLVRLMMLVIKEELGSKPENYHSRLVRNLVNGGKINETVFVSTNYDILIDNALDNLPGFALDYGIDFINMANRNCSRPNRSMPNEPIELYKLHGSLNWLYCRTCNTIKLTSFQKAAARSLACDICDSKLSTLVVPPTYFKSLTNAYLGMLWVKAEAALRKAQHLIFCGYSFPDADIHIKYLIKRVESHCEHDPLITVINNHEGKTSESKQGEKNRFQRFLKRVNYTDVCFEEFASSPLDYWE